MFLGKNIVPQWIRSHQFSLNFTIRNDNIISIYDNMGRWICMQVSGTHNLIQDTFKTSIKKIKNQKYLLLFALPGVIWFIIFSYIPMAGIIIAFKDYNLIDGFVKSPWVGFDNFKQFFQSVYFGRIMINTIGISVLKLIIGFPIPIIFAILLNEITNDKFKRITQTISYMPHFISWVVTLAVFNKLLALDDGIINNYGYALD